MQGYYAVIGGREVIIKNQTEKYYVADEGKKASGNEIVPIRPATLCQCTGLKDKNGNLIWEGGIIKLLPSGNYFNDDVSNNYWETTEGNTKRALTGLLAFAQM